MKAPHLTFLIGASGAGKSALRRKVSQASLAHCIAFDNIFTDLGVPALGESEQWQLRATVEWCRRIALLAQPHVLLDGQTRYSFAAEACATAGIASWAIILVHCERAAREARLVQRGEPELVNEPMAQWADWLKRDASERGLPIIDTTELSVDEAYQRLAALLGAPARHS
jgi:hypothetical protein